MAEFFRQFAFVSSLLGGFSLAFFGTLLSAAKEHRIVGPAAALALAASACFLIVTLGNTFAASIAAGMAASARFPAAIMAHQGPLSILFLLGVLLLLGSFGAAGWTRSRKLGLATSVIALLTLIGVIWVMRPFVKVNA